MKKNSKKRRENWFLVAVLISFALAGIINFVKPAFTGYSVLDSSIMFDQNTTFDVGNITSLKVSGIIEGSGSVKIYLDDYVVLDSNLLRTDNTMVINFTDVCIETCSGVSGSRLRTVIEGEVLVIIENTIHTVANTSEAPVSDDNNNLVNETNETINNITDDNFQINNTVINNTITNLTINNTFNNTTDNNTNNTNIITPNQGTPNIKLKNKYGSDIGDISITNRTDGRFDVEITSEKDDKTEAKDQGRQVSISSKKISKATLKGLKSKDVTIKLDDYSGPAPPSITTQVIAVNNVSIDNATIRLAKSGNVNKLLKCTDFDIGAFNCDSWSVTSIPFSDYNNYIEFVVDGFSAYAGGEVSSQSTPGDIGSCQTLDTAGTYTLTANASNTSTCMSIASSNVTLDCAGYTIFYGNGSRGYGVNATSATNVTVKNCIIEKLGGTDSDNYGIYFTRVNNSLVFNNSIRTNGTISNYGVYISTGDMNNISSNNIYSNGSLNINRGIYLYSTARNNTISNNVISTGGTTDNPGIYGATTINNNMISNNNVTATGSSNSNQGIYIGGNANNNTISNNIISTNGQSFNYGVYLTSTADNNVVNNNNVTTTGTGNANYGIYLINTVRNNTVSNNVIRTNGTGDNYGIRLTTADNNIVSGNNITTSGTAYANYGIYLVTTVRNNTVSNNVISTGGTSNNFGIYLLTTVTGNNITGNNITASGTQYSNYGIFLSSANSNNISSNRITTNGTTDNAGIKILTSDSSNFYDNIVNSYANASVGINISGSINNFFYNNQLNVTHQTSNELATTFTSGVTPQNNTIVNLTLVRTGYLVSIEQFNGTILKSIKSSEAPAGSVTGTRNLNKYFNITNTSPNSWLYLNVSYTDSEITAITESTLRIWKYNSSSNWTNESFYDTNSYGVDMANNIVYANITSFSTFGLFGVDEPPNVTIMSPTDGATTTNNYVVVNISITRTPDLAEFKFNWNSTNYTIYNDSLVLMLNFDNVSSIGDNSTHIKDLSKHGNNGTITGASYVSGKYGSALQYDGNDYITIVNSNSLNTSEVTITAWVNISQNNPNELYVLTPVSEGSEAWFYAGPETLPLSTSNSSWNLANSTQKIAASVNDSDRWETKNTTGHDQYDFQLYRFDTAPFYNITNINMTWLGYGENQSGYNVTLFIWNATNSSWEQLSTSNLSSDGILDSTRTNINDYVNSNNGYVYVAASAKHYDYAPTVSDAGRSPASGATAQSQTPTLSWSAWSDPDGDTDIQYYAELHTGTTCSALSKTRNWSSATSWATGAIAGGASFSWHVRARSNSTYTDNSSWNSCYTFTTTGGGSCPFLYTWNGTEFNYKTDLSGQSIGFREGHPRSNVVKYYNASIYPVDNFVADENNTYKLKIREVIDETTYFDNIKLITIDHPPGYKIYSASMEVLYSFGKTNSLSYYSVKDPILPISAVDNYGNDILENLSFIDDNTATMEINELNYYILDFGNISHPEYAKLILDAWVIYMGRNYSTKSIPSSVEVINESGQWEKVREFGSISGDYKTVVLNISNIFKSSDQRIKFYPSYTKRVVPLIDRIMLDDSEPIEIEPVIINVSLASLYHRGSQSGELNIMEHKSFAKDDVVPDSQSSYYFGNFTKYGDVKELLDTDDDMFVIMRHGDEMSIEFNGTSVPEGMERSTLLYANVFYKLFNDATEHDHSIYPLPFLGMTKYPYNTSVENYPNDTAHLEYLSEWNTRVCDNIDYCYDSKNGSIVFNWTGLYGEKYAENLAYNVPSWANYNINTYSDNIKRSINTNLIKLELNGNMKAKIISKLNAYELLGNTSTVTGRINGNNLVGGISSGWQHLALTYNGSLQAFYISGSLIAQANITNTTSIQNITIGANLTGSMDEVRIWNISFTPQEILQVYYSSLNKYDTDKWTFYTNQSNLTDGTYNFSAYAKDTFGNDNSTETRTFISDSTPPQIMYGNGTETNTSFLQRTWLFVNVSVTEINEANITFYLYNSTLLVNSSLFTTPARSVNFTNLADGVYSFNVSVMDIVGNINTTETRTVTLDTNSPLIDFTTGTATNNSYNAQSFIFINVSVIEANEANVTFSLFNSTYLVNSTVYNAGNRSINFTSLSDGVYYYNVTVFDLAGRSNSTETRIITLDTITPLVTSQSINDTDSIISSNYTVKFNVSVTDTNILSVNISNISSVSMSQSGTTWEVNTNATALGCTDITGQNCTVMFTAIDRAGNVNNSVMISFEIDNIAPYNVTLFNPTPADNGVGGEDIIMNWSVYDNRIQNLTCYPSVDGVLQSGLLTQNGSYANASLTLAGGQRNLSVRCYDHTGNYNNSEYRIYTVGKINITSPLQNSIVRPDDALIFNVSILSGQDYINNISIIIDNLVTRETLIISNTSVTAYNATYNVTSVSPRYLNVTAYGWNTAVGNQVNVTSNIQLRLLRALSNTSSPTITYTCANETYTLNAHNVTITATFDLDTLFKAVNLTVLHPNNSTIVIDSFWNSTDDSGDNSYISTFNFTYAPNATGSHIVTVTVKDYENQTYTVNRTIVSGPARVMNWTSSSISNIQVKDACSGNVLFSGATITGTIPDNALFDLQLTLNNEPRNVSFVNANISYQNVTNLLDYTTRTNESDPPSGQRRVAMFDIEANMTFDNYTLVYNYSSIWYSINDESSLKIYKCSNISNCDFVLQETTVNTTTKEVILTSANMSRFILTEPGTTTVTQTVTTSAGGGGGGSSKTIREKVAFSIIPTTPVTMYSEDTIRAKVMITNIGEVEFDKISINVTSRSDDISAEPVVYEITNLPANQTETFDVDLTSHTLPGLYEVDLYGESSTPQFSQRTKLIVNLIEKEVEVERAKIVERVTFAYDMFKENPECLELQELITQANEAMERNETAKAASLVEAAINACKETVTSLNVRTPGLQSTGKGNRIVIIVLWLTPILWMIMEYLHRKNRKLKKHKKKQVNRWKKKR